MDVTIVLLGLGDDAALTRSAGDARAQRDVTTELLPCGPGAPAEVCTAAVRAARGRWIAFLEAGDRWRGDRLYRTVAAAEAAGAAWAYGARLLVGAADRIVGTALAEDPAGVHDRLRDHNVVGGPSAVLCRRDLLTGAQPFDTRLRALTFWRAWLALAEREGPGACTDALVAERADGALIRSPRRSLRELRRLREEGVLRADGLWHGMWLASELRRYGRRRAAAAVLATGAPRHRRPQDLVRALAAAIGEPPHVDGYARPGWLDGARNPDTPRSARIRAAGRCEVSVVVPTRNRPGFLRQAVRSALAQEDVDLEVIVVDDASDLPEARTALRFDDRRVHVQARGSPGGAGRARNAALASARGEWIAFLDDDDLFAPARLRAHLDQAGTAGFGYCGQLLVDSGRRAVGAWPAPPTAGLAHRLRVRSSIGGPTAVIARTELVREVGGFDPEYYALADWDLWVRLAARATAVAVPELLVAYTVHPSNMHLHAPERMLADFRRFERVHDVPPAAELELLAWLAAELDQAGRRGAAARLHLRVARRHRRAESLVRALRAIRYRAPCRPATSHLLGPAWLDPYRAADEQ